MVYAPLVCSLLFSEHCSAAWVCFAPLKYCHFEVYAVYLRFDFAVFSLADGVVLTCFPQNVYLFGKRYQRRNSRCFQPVRLPQLRLAAAALTAVYQAACL